MRKPARLQRTCQVKIDGAIDPKHFLENESANGGLFLYIYFYTFCFREQ
jgi:hypothetical protein